MCGRYNLIETGDYVSNLFECKNALKFPKRYNIAPSQPVTIIRNRIDGPKDEINQAYMQLAQWGFIADWMKTPPSTLIINARSETACIKPMFRGAIEQNRCIIPASGWYEWKTINGVKQPFHFCKDSSKTNQALLAFAGLYSRFMAADGSEIDTVAILTKPAIGKIANIHHRMPCLLSEHNYQNWLNGWHMRGRNALKLIDDDQADQIMHYPVSTNVGNARLDNAELIQAIQLEPTAKPKIDDQLSLF